MSNFNVPTREKLINQAGQQRNIYAAMGHSKNALVVQF
jgi:hypothetical protein